MGPVMDRKHIDKMIAVALSPGAYEEEAIVALRKAREVVKKNPALAHPDPPSATTSPAAPKPDNSIQYRVSKISDFWLPILMGNLSEQAYGLGLRSKLSCDFSETLRAVNIRCDGPEAACDAFVAHLNWLLNHINSQPPQT
jgi:hypothetical protein